MLKTLTLAALVASTSLIAAQPATAQEDARKLPALPISEDVTVPRHEIAVLDSTMSYLEQGEGEVVLFLHGNPARPICGATSCPTSRNTIAPSPST